MDYEIITLEEKNFTGICVRTGNNEPDMAEKIGNLWFAYYSEVFQKIAGQKNNTSYGIYTNYENGITGKYDILACCETDGNVSNQNVDSLRNITIPAAKYAKFSFQGNMQTDLPLFWGKIWATPLERTFTYDFEEYPPCQDQNHAEIHIYIAIHS